MYLVKLAGNKNPKKFKQGNNTSMTGNRQEHFSCVPNKQHGAATDKIWSLWLL